MLLHQFQSYTLGLLLFGMGTIASADGLDCSGPVTDTEVAICNDPALSDLASLAEDIGNAVGLDIRYSDLDSPIELNQRFDRLLRTLTVDDMDKLAVQRREGMFSFDETNKILFIAGGSTLQEMMIVFDLDGTVAHIEMMSEDAGRYFYSAVGNILEVESSFSPASFTNKFRYQDGCWRLIGEDASWRDEDPYKHSINYLTGQAIFDYKDGSSVTRTFDPQVSCLGDNFYAHEVQYHDD